VQEGKLCSWGKRRAFVIEIKFRDMPESGRPDLLSRPSGIALFRRGEPPV
jgi:hypothetical protein